jgi:D-threo-aldose 1-dehydrogenase
MTASKPDRIAEDRAAFAATVPADFWRDLRAAGLVNPLAPLPGDQVDLPS